MSSIKQLSILQKGFTLVELLIVVIILAILAAIVVPQFSSSTDDAKEASMDTTLANMRSAIDLYYQQHGHYPGNAVASGATCPGGGTAGVGDLTSPATRATAFMSQLSMYTNAAGQACSTTDATFEYGPYLKKDAMPVNSVTNSNALAIVTAGNLVMTGAAAPGLGWQFDVITGKLIADHVDYDDR